VRLAPIPESAARARDFVEETLGTWQCHDLVDDVRVVVTELVSNVVRHAGTEVDIELELLDGGLRVRVSDRAGGTVTLPRVDERSEGGRGLRLVDELASRWGVDQRAGAKCVWAEWQVAGRPTVRA
jgi:anti-sigma regulatory factor (Ser/Thr protein kinase)